MNPVRLSAPRKLTKTSSSCINFGVEKDGAKEGATVVIHLRRPKLKQQSSENWLSFFFFFGFLSSSFFGFQVLSLPLFSVFCKFSNNFLIERKSRFSKKKMKVSNGDKRRMEKTKNRKRKKDREDYNVGPTERQKER